VVAILVALAALDVGGIRTRLFAPPPIRSIAVLPLANLSGDPGQEYFADGMTEALINDLGQVSALRVISRTSAMQYKGTKKGLKEIARELGVDGVVEGSVVRSDGRVKVTAQLVRAALDRQMWAQSYEREVRDVLVMQGEIAQAIVTAVQAVATPDQAKRLASAKQVDPEAQEAFLRGRHFLPQWTESGVRTAIGYFEQALARDSRLAPAYAGLAEAYYMLGAGGLEVIPPREGYEKAREAALKALSLDENLSEAHTILAAVYQEYDWKFEKAVEENERALELNPNNGLALINYAQLLEYYRHDYARATELARKAVEVDPLTPFVHANLAYRYSLSGRLDEAVAEARRALATEPNFWITRWSLGEAYLGKGRTAEAITEFQRAAELSDSNTFVRASLGFALARTGRKAEATAIIRDFERLRRTGHVAAYCTMKIYAGLGERDSAFAWAERSFRERGSVVMATDATTPVGAVLRSDPRFAELIHRMGLPAP
jgi:TolB-like protein/Flp pilus assembly protein TadD